MSQDGWDVRPGSNPKSDRLFPAVSQGLFNPHIQVPASKSGSTTVGAKLTFENAEIGVIVDPSEKKNPSIHSIAPVTAFHNQQNQQITMNLQHTGRSFTTSASMSSSVAKKRRIVVVGAGFLGEVYFLLSTSQRGSNS